MPPWPGRPIVRAEAPRAARGPRARRPSSRALVGQRLTRIPAGGASSCSSTSTATGSSSTRCSPAGSSWPLRAPSGRPRPPSSSASERGSAGPPSDAAAWTRGADWLPPDDAEVEVRYRDPTQMGKVYLLPAGLDRAVPGLDDELGPDADDPGLEPRRLAGAHPTPSGRAQEPAQEPGVRRRDRERLQRRDPPRRCGCCRSASGRRSRPEEVDALYDATRTTRRSGRDRRSSRRASRRPSRPRSATSWRSTTRAARPARAAARGSPRSSRAGS